MTFEVLILGSSSATPIYQRHPTAQVITFHDKLFLVDCGEGTLIQFNRYHVRFHRINHIFISHIHGDHYLGLMGTLSTMHLQGRTNELVVHGPHELKEIVEVQLKYSQTVLRYPLRFVETNPTTPEMIYEDDLMEVHTIILNHRIACTGFLFKEKPKPRKLIREKLEQYDVPLSFYPDLKAGKDFTAESGKIISNAELTIAGNTSRSYAFCSDTIFDETLIERVRNVTLLYHEATFLNEHLERAKDTYHTTASQAATIALKADVRRLIIGHFSARYKNLYPLLEEAKAVFDNTTLATEGDIFSIEY